MTDYIKLALKYGGFTSLDRVYLGKVLDKLSDSQKLTFITPPPSVINAYFSELYQKKSPEAATDYFLELSKELALFNDHPNFEEENVIRMIPAIPEEVVQKQPLSALTDLYKLADGRLKLEGYNQEELIQLAQDYAGQLYYRSQKRSAMIYIKEK